MAKAYVAALQTLPADKLPGRKDEARQVNSAFQFLARNHLLPPDFPPKLELETFVKTQFPDKRPQGR
jgi:hypothetical protein